MWEFWSEKFFGQIITHEANSVENTGKEKLKLFFQSFLMYGKSTLVET